MDLIKLEIEKKRKQLEELQQSNKKYIKRGDLQEKLAEINRKQYLNETSTETSLNGSEKRSNSEILKAKQLKKEDDIKQLPRNEVIRRLRELNEPIRLFGESDIDSNKRLNILELQDKETNGMRNDFKVAIEKSEQESLNEIMNSIQDNNGDDGNKIESKHDQEVLDEEVALKEVMELADLVEKDKINNKKDEQRDRSNDFLLVVKYLKFLIKKWASVLQARSQQEKLSTGGKIDAALQAQSAAYLKPLFRKLKSKTLPDDILDSLVKIVLELLDRNYIKANEYFLEMAIGNAPWPIGATMVGIHARPGRERIASKHVARKCQCLSVPLSSSLFYIFSKMYLMMKLNENIFKQ